MNSVLFLVFTLALASASAAAPFGLRDYITLQLDDLFRHAEGGQAPRIRSRAGTSFPSPQRVVGVGSDPHCPVHPEASSQLTAPTPAIQAALDAISALCSKSIAGGPTGCFVSAVYMGESWLEQGFGTINGEAGGPVPDADTVFNIASVSKVFTTLLAAKAIEDGAVRSWTTALEELDASFSVKPPQGLFAVNNPGPITLGQLLSHQGGLSRESPCPAVQVTNTSVATCPATTAEVLAALAQLPRLYESWHEPSYSNLGFSLLGRLVAQAVGTGATYEDQVVAMTAAFGMRDTLFFGRPTTRKIATGFARHGVPLPPFDLGFDNPAGGVMSTGRDLTTLVTRLTSAWVGAGQGGAAGGKPPVSDEMIRSLSQPARWVNPGGTSGFGTPWEIFYLGGYAARTKAGNLNSWASSISFVPELGIGLVGLWNGPFDSSGFSKQAMSLLIPAMVEALTPLRPAPVQPTAGRGAEVYKGTFSNVGVVISVQTLPDGRITLAYGSARLLISFVSSLDGTDTFSLYVYGDSLPCLAAEFASYNAETVVFQMDPTSGNATSIAIPGLLHGLVFPRVSST